jgi:hypothetical protein
MNGCVDEDGRFIWRSGSSIADETMSEEIQNFLLDDQETLACNQGIDLGSMEMGVGGMEVPLPEDILPSFEKTDKGEVVEIDQQGKTRKKKVWGPVQATRQSSRVDRSMNVMKKAIEYKKKNNLEEPNKKMKGIMHSNAFQSLDVDYLESLARNVGVDIFSVSASGEKEENHDTHSRSHRSIVVSPMNVLLDLEIPRETITHESLCVPLLPNIGDLVTTPLISNRKCRENYEDEGEMDRGY